MIIVSQTCDNVKMLLIIQFSYETYHCYSILFSVYVGYLPLPRERGYVFACVCLSVCLSVC